MIALAGFAAYAYLRAIGIGTGSEERVAIVGLVAVMLGVAAIAHLAAVQLRPGRREELAR